MITLLQDSFNFLIPEDMNISSSLGMILAYDRDLESNGEIEFEIVSGDPRFSIVTTPVASSNDRQIFSGSLYTDEVRIHMWPLLNCSVTVIIISIAI